MAWITLVKADLKGVLAGAEYNAITTAALNAGQDGGDLVEEEMNKVTNLVRGFCGKGTLGLADTIPDELKDAALNILRVNVITRLPMKGGSLTEARMEAKDDAMRLLRDVASGKFSVVRPVNPAPDAQQAATSSIKTISAPRKRFTRSSLGGLYGTR